MVTMVLVLDFYFVLINEFKFFLYWSIVDDTTLIAESEEELKEPLDESERGE